ncbi:60S acidic ribosomal protein P2-like [Harmonia axyridis]|uniref:60S acidic ribosomal protein P2-like n=1 Tax=Harmonia axyridis TaxID=115357 RepID=UPI001E27507E|nr:60S acidic ribosomal protein P2-like [Harmonia axyridis]
MVKKVIDELNGMSIDEVIAQGQGKLASVPSGGAVAVPTAASGGAAAPAAEEKKEEKKKEEPAESESDDDMGALVSSTKLKNNYVFKF